LETLIKKLYEAMFLVDSAQAQSDWDVVNATIKNILERAEAEIVSIKKWDERRLAYEIDGKARGTYILCYFKADGRKIGDIERDVQLSERIMRVLILCGDHLREEDVEEDTPAIRAEKHKQEAAREAAEKAEAEQESTQQVVEEAGELEQTPEGGESEQSAEAAVADVAESDQPDSEKEAEDEKAAE